MSAAVESYNPRGSASFIEQRQAAKECKSQSVIMSSMRLLVKTFSRIQTELCYECQSRLKTPSQLVGVSCHAKAKGTVRRRGGGRQLSYINEEFRSNWNNASYCIASSTGT